MSKRDPRREPSVPPDPRCETDDEVDRMREVIRKTSSPILPAVQRMATASRKQVDAAEQLARTARQSRPKSSGVRTKPGLSGDLTAKFAALKG